MTALLIPHRPEVGSEPILQACAMAPNTDDFMTWTYHDASGVPRFQHFRKRCESTPENPRHKRYGYRYPEDPSGRVACWDGWVWRKPAVADELLFRLPLVLREPDRTLVLTEGERDCLEFIQRGVLASCHHGGAGKFTDQQAESLAGHRGDIVLVADHDAAGAVDVTHRWMQLRRVRIKPHQLSILLPATPEGTDARDHFEAGYGLDDFATVSYRDMRATADAHPSALSDAGYWGLTEEERALPTNLKDWKPVTHEQPCHPLGHRRKPAKGGRSR